MKPHTRNEDLAWFNNTKFEWDDNPVMSYSATVLEKEEIKILLVPENFNKGDEVAYIFTTYKQVANKIKPVSTTFPKEVHVRCQIPLDPLEQQQQQQQQQPPPPPSPPRIVALLFRRG